MATTPAYANVAIVGTGLANATLDTSLTAPTNVTTLTFSTAIGSSGAKIEELRVIGVATTSAGNLNVFLYDGSTYHLFDQFAITAVTSSTTAVAFYTANRYDNFFVPNGWSVRFTVTVSGNQSILKVVALGANF